MSLMTCSLTWERENNLFPPATLDILCNREEMFPCVKQTLFNSTKKRKWSFKWSFNQPQVIPNLYKLIFFCLKKKNEDTLNHVGGVEMFYRFHLALALSSCLWIPFVLPHSVFLFVYMFFKETDLTDEDAAFSEGHSSVHHSPPHSFLFFQ